MKAQTEDKKGNLTIKENEEQISKSLSEQKDKQLNSASKTSNAKKLKRLRTMELSEKSSVSQRFSISAIK